MGWMWSSSSSAAIPAKRPSQEKSETQAPAKETQSTTTTTSTNDYGDPEIAKFMAQIQEELNPKPAAPTPTSTPTSSQTAPPEQQQQQQKSSSSLWPSWGSSSSSSSTSSSPTTTSSKTAAAAATPSQSPPPTRLDPLSESLLPTTMSCRAAFDSAFHCNSLGGQWTSVYRSGTMRSCSEQWDDFWFCMRTRAYTGAMKEEAIRDFYRQKEIKRYYAAGQPSSTDVWEARTERVEPGTAFSVPLGEGAGGGNGDVSDEEWYALEIERRRRVQEALKGS